MPVVPIEVLPGECAIERAPVSRQVRRRDWVIGTALAAVAAAIALWPISTEQSREAELTRRDAGSRPPARNAHREPRPQSRVKATRRHRTRRPPQRKHERARNRIHRPAGARHAAAAKAAPAAISAAPAPSVAASQTPPRAPAPTSPVAAPTPGFTGEFF